MSNKVNWNSEQIEFIKNNYNNMTYTEIGNLYNVSEGSVCLLCKKLDLVKNNKWSNDEIEILKNNVDCTIEQLLVLLKNKTNISIYKKLKYLGINAKLINEVWSINEDKILIKASENCNSIEEIETLLPNRSIRAISNRFYKLGLKLKQVECLLITKLDGYGKGKSKLSNYRRKFGIILDKSLIIDTYDIIQWWKWTYYSTPNGKQLKCIPLELINLNNLNILLRYVITEIIGYKTREQILQLDFKTFSKYRISFHHFYKSSLIDYLNLIFPEYNIKPFELKNVPLGYWQDVNNCDEYMEYVLKNYFHVNEMRNIKQQIPSFFTFKNIRLLGYSKLACCITENKQYSSFYEWLNKLHPEWNLTSDDFKEHIAFDGSKLNSNEEVLIYTFMKKYFNLNIKAIGLNKSKYKFHNIISNENYIPDFFIKHNDKIIIIEYFGLFDDNCKDLNNSMFKNYYYKTLRKVEYYKSNPDIYFIDLYPTDLKNNFEGVRKKLTSFFMSNFNINLKEAS